jgi:hypothetical protein
MSTQARRILTVGATPMIVGSAMPLADQAVSHLHPELRLLPDKATFMPRRRDIGSNKLGFHEFLS